MRRGGDSSYMSMFGLLGGGLGFRLENKERSNYSLMANMDITLGGEGMERGWKGEKKR